MLRIPGRTCAAVSLFALSFLLPFAAHAVQRTFVSISGSDANTASNCSATAPCRGFAAALTVTDSGGEIIVQNSGGYGAVAIDKSVSIIAPDGVYAGISVSTGYGITIATAGVKVVLRGLTINGQGGANGVYMTAGDGLTVENCHISNFSNAGLLVETGAKVGMARSVFLNNYIGARFNAGATALIDETQFSSGHVGVYAHATGASTSTRVEAVRSSSSFMSAYGFFVHASDGGSSAMSVTRSSANSNGDSGYYATADLVYGTTVHIEVKDSVASKNRRGAHLLTDTSTVRGTFTGNLLSRNTEAGLSAYGPGTTLTVSGNTITHNATGLKQASSALVESAGDNTVRQNTASYLGTITAVAKM